MTTSIPSRFRAELLGALLAGSALVGCTGDLSSHGTGGAPAQGLGGAAGISGGAPGGTVGSGVPATDPGRVTMHRLNLVEYDNTMRDLLGTQTRPSVDFKFPPDDRGKDFDNAADVLTVSPQHLNGYNAAVTALLAEAMKNPAQRAQLVSCDLATGGESCARSSLEAFVPRAWRREVSAAEIDGLTPLIATAKSHGDSVEVGLTLALRATLLSPYFLYRPELDPDPKSLTPHPLGQYELASRVSYFLWSSMPDAALFAAAKAGTLHDPATLTGQVTRMLTDAKGQALIDNFAGQWLFIRLFDEIRPDPTLFPGFDEPLRAAFKAETQLLFREFAFNGMPADQLLTANFTFANDRLAQFYGLPAVTGSEFKRVELGAAQRRGLLSQAGLLAANAHPDASSPVRRGKYVLEELLCQGVPPPPPGVDTTIKPDSSGAKTLRQVLETHLLNPTCAACHSLMDPIGFGMENYDAVGAYRTTDNGLPIDATGALPSGEKFNGALELAQLLAKDPGFARCLTNKLYVYALGRSAVIDDAKHLDASTLAAISTQFAVKGLKFQDLALSVATSPTFLNRRGDGS